MPTMQTQKTDKNPNLYHSHGFYEGIADRTKILGQNIYKNKNPDQIKYLKERNFLHILKSRLLS